MQPSLSTDLDESFEACPECAYDGGFHVLLQRHADVGDAGLRIHLKCPSCRTTYDVGWIGRLVH